MDCLGTSGVGVGLKGVAAGRGKTSQNNVFSAFPLPGTDSLTQSSAPQWAAQHGTSSPLLTTATPNPTPPLATLCSA